MPESKNPPAAGAAEPSAPKQGGGAPSPLLPEEPLTVEHSAPEQAFWYAFRPRPTTDETRNMSALVDLYASVWS